MIFFRIFMMALFLSDLLHSDIISVSDQTNNLSILKQSELFIASKEYSAEEILTKKFEPAQTFYLNLGLTTNHVWARFTLENRLNKPVVKLLVINNPVLVFVDIYQTKDSSLYKIDQRRKTLAPSYGLSLPAHSKTTYYMYIKSLTSLKFGLLLYEQQRYLSYDHKQEMINMFFLGVIITMIIYNLLLYFFIRKRSYLYYLVYLLVLIMIEASYLGFTARYLPQQYFILDNRLMLEKVVLLLIFYILYSMNFLRLQKKDNFAKVLIVILVTVGIVSLWVTLSYQLRLKIVLALVMLAAHVLLAFSIIIYFRGQKEVRFYILGFLTIYLAYVVVLLDALGLISVVYHMQNILIIATAIEAILLSIAFIDNYKHLQEEKLQKEHQLVKESQHRELLIQKEVVRKTDQLQHAMTMQELLFYELHHRVKNNLQLIISITRMQKKGLQSHVCKRNFQALEERINAIATTHNTIYLSKELEIISMEEYIIKLVEGLRASDLENKIIFKYDIDLNMVLKNAINMGLIVNELVSNALKHAFDKNSGTIKILLKDGLLEITDDGKGFDSSIEKEENLGMKLVQILVKDQLKGDMNITTNDNGTKITIRFFHAQ